MTDREQIEAFGRDLDALVERYRAEFELTYAAVIGLLYVKATQLTIEASSDDDDEEED